jgi:hypothetical protein
MRPHEILTSPPGWRQLAADRAKLARAEAKHRQRLADTTTRNDKALAEHTKAYTEAILEGNDPPPPPQLEQVDANLAGASRLLIDRGRELDQQERRFLADHGATLERQLAVRHDELLAEARPALAKLEAVAEEMRTLTASTAMVREANDDRRPVTEGRITAAMIAEVVARGGSFLRPGPAPATTSYSASFSKSDDEEGAALFTPETGGREPLHTGDPRLSGRR